MPGCAAGTVLAATEAVGLYRRDFGGRQLPRVQRHSSQPQRLQRARQTKLGCREANAIVQCNLNPNESDLANAVRQARRSKTKHRRRKKNLPQDDSEDLFGGRQAGADGEADEFELSDGALEGGVDMVTPAHLLPKVALVGRPNVGKSALFNRLVGAQAAIVYDRPGVTRDRMYARGDWNGREIMFIDTGGLQELPEEEYLGEANKLAGAAANFPRRRRDDDEVYDQESRALKSLEGLPRVIGKQVAVAVKEADVVVMVVDGMTGAIDGDVEVARWLQRAHPDLPKVLAVNKCESQIYGASQVSEFWKLGVGEEPFPISALSGSGTGELLDKVCEVLPEQVTPEDSDMDQDEELRIAIVGRPNVGKSSILNALVGEERQVVGSVAGTTMDAVDSQTEWNGRKFTLIDTAGLRRRTKVASAKDGAEDKSVERALRAVQRCDVAMLVLDVTQDVAEQDMRIAEQIEKAGRACVIVVNKWDAYPDKHTSSLNEVEKTMRARLYFFDWAPFIFTSAVTKQRLQQIFAAAIAAGEEHRRRISTATINMVIQEATSWKMPPSTRGGKRGRIYYATQSSVRPPTFIFFCNDPDLFPITYRRYILRQLREQIGFPGTPIRLFWRPRERSTK